MDLSYKIAQYLINIKKFRELLRRKAKRACLAYKQHKCICTTSFYIFMWNRMLKVSCIYSNCIFSCTYKIFWEARGFFRQQNASLNSTKIRLIQSSLFHQEATSNPNIQQKKLLKSYYAVIAMMIWNSFCFEKTLEKIYF